MAIKTAYEGGCKKREVSVPDFCSRFFISQGLEKMAITVNEAGHRGGLEVLRRRGRNFFASIGKKGQEAMRVKYPGMARQWGKLGGRPRKLPLDSLGEESN